MISVLGPLPMLAVRQLHGSKWFLTLEDYSFRIVVHASSGPTSYPYGMPHIITIPAGYRFDRASIPTVAGIIVTKDSLGCLGPLLHDALYRCDGRLERAPLPNEVKCSPYRYFTRAEADEAFREVMLADHIKPWRARLAYWAVRQFARRW